MSAHIVSARIMLAHIVALLVSLVAGLRAAFGQSRMRLCRAWPATGSQRSTRA